MGQACRKHGPMEEQPLCCRKPDSATGCGRMLHCRQTIAASVCAADSPEERSSKCGRDAQGEAEGSMAKDATRHSHNDRTTHAIGVRGRRACRTRPVDEPAVPHQARRSFPTCANVRTCFRAWIRRLSGRAGWCGGGCCSCAGSECRLTSNLSYRDVRMVSGGRVALGGTVDTARRGARKGASSFTGEDADRSSKR